MPHVTLIIISILIFRCCKSHDQCYDAYNAGSWWTRQCKIDFRLLPYSFNCNSGTCTCNSKLFIPEMIKQRKTYNHT